MSTVPTAERLPSALIDRDQWVCWKTENRDGKETKIPVDPASGRYASTTDPSTWTEFVEARRYAVETDTVSGLGFVFTDDDPFVGVDLDNCRDDDGSSPKWATQIIDQLDSYTEVSPSGTGFHNIVRGDLPEGPNRRGDIECYETARYFTVTGDSVHDPPRAVEARTTELAAVHAEYVAEDAANEGHTTKLPPGTPEQRASSTLDDETVLEKARAAANSAKFERLWNGSTSGYDSHSEADMALCFHLAFWTGADAAQIDRLFRQSGLMRGKWDEVHFSDGSTYGEKTVERAVTRVDDVYEPTDSDRRHIEQDAQPASSTAGESGRRRTSHESMRNDQREQRLLGLIDRLEARVDSLAAENESLREELERERAKREENHRASEEHMSEDESLWSRVRSRFNSG